MLSNEKLIIDVRTREEYAKDHIISAINIPLHDLDFYLNYLKGKKIFVYCSKEYRSKIAVKLLNKEGVNAKILTGNWNKDYKREKRGIICAVNYVEVKPGDEKIFEDSVKQLCQKTNEIKGFLGSKLLKLSGMSCVGSGLAGDLNNLEFIPSKYIIMTYWESKQDHEESHKHPIFKEAFSKIPKYLSKMPYEEFYEILK